MKAPEELLYHLAGIVRNSVAVSREHAETIAAAVADELAAHYPNCWETLEGIKAGRLVAVKTEAVKPAMYPLSNGYGFYVNPTGRFHGWVFVQHPDGQWVSSRMVEPNYEPFDKALAAAPKPGDAP